MSTWADVAKGDRVELGGQEWTVEKIKPKGKRAKVTVTGKRGTFTNEVKLKDEVAIVGLHDKTGAQTRWAVTSDEAAGGDCKGCGHPWSIHGPQYGCIEQGCKCAWNKPRKERVSTSENVGDVWDTPIDKVEKKLMSILGAHLIGESHDGGKEWYVPPVDVTTVTAHWMTFHGGDTWHNTSSSDLLPLHEAEHAEADAGTRVLEVKHVHTKDRPGKVAS